MNSLDRRAFLESALLSGALCLAGNPRAIHAARRDLPSVVIVIHREGTRLADTLEAPIHCPRLAEIAAGGVLYTACNRGGETPAAATRAILTGVPEGDDPAQPAHRDQPTLFEYLRRQTGASPFEAWLVGSASAAPETLAASPHPDYGPALGARVFHPEDALRPELLALARAGGTKGALAPADEAALPGLRAALVAPEGSEAAIVPARVMSALDAFVRTEAERPDLRSTEPGVADARSLRAAARILTHAAPRLLVVVLEGSGVADRSYEDYLAALRRGDEALGELGDAIRGNERRRERTALLVVSAMGRNQRVRDGICGRDDGSLSVRRSWLVAIGPGIRSGAVVKASVDATDTCATAARLLGIEAEHSRGRLLRQLLE